MEEESEGGTSAGNGPGSIPFSEEITLEEYLNRQESTPGWEPVFWDSATQSPRDKPGKRDNIDEPILGVESSSRPRNFPKIRGDFGESKNRRDFKEPKNKEKGGQGVDISP